jgi:hypothetical protein
MSYTWKTPKQRNSTVNLVLQSEAILDKVGDVWDDEPKRGYKLDVIYSKTHKSGWTITAKMSHVGCLPCVTDFTAKHEKYGELKGNYDTEITSTNKEAFDHFYSKHSPYSYDTFDD